MITVKNSRWTPSYILIEFFDALHIETPNKSIPV